MIRLLVAILLATTLSATALAAFFPTYDIVTFMPDVPEDGAVIRIALVQKVQLIAGLPNATCIAKAAATASTTVTINKVSGGAPTAIGTFVWSAAATTCAITFASDVDFAIGDIIELVFPVPADTTLANIAISMPGTREQ